MLREAVFTASLLGIQALVVVHWFLLPDNPLLAALAVVAGVVMGVMALLDALLFISVLRKDPSDRQQHAELLDLASIEPLWVAITLAQVAFTGTAVVAGVYWLAWILVIGQGSELLAVATARLRTRGASTDAPETAG